MYYVREFLIASGCFLLCLAWTFRAPLRSGKPFDAGVKDGARLPDALDSPNELVYEIEPALLVQTDELKKGTFPLWSPYSQGGTPLIGKMQNGVFAPFHIPLYVLPTRWTPWIFTVIVLLKAYLAFAFVSLFARSVRLNPGWPFWHPCST